MKTRKIHNVGVACGDPYLHMGCRRQPLPRDVRVIQASHAPSTALPCFNRYGALLVPKVRRSHGLTGEAGGLEDAPLI